MFSDFLVAVSNNRMENIERDRSQSTEMLPEVANVIIGDIGYARFCRNILVFFGKLVLLFLCLLGLVRLA